MLKINQKPTFWSEVKFQLPGEEAATFRAKFRVRGVGEVDATDFADAGQSAQFLRDTIISLDDIVGKNDQPEKFSNELLDLLLDQPHIRSALSLAYTMGVAGAARGN